MSAENSSWFDRNYFVLRRLHSLAGIVPIGVFLINHLLTNSTAALGRGGSKFDEHVFWLHSIPYLVFVEFGLIILPLLFHAAFGVVIALTARHNVLEYGYADNWRYTLQRWTGWIAFFFVILHLGHFRFAYLLGQSHYVGTPAPFDAMQQGFHRWLPTGLWLTIYAIGLVASVFHFSNGITTFCIKWGITVNDSSRRKVSLLSLGVGLLLLVWGGMSLYAIARVAPERRLGGPTGGVHAALVENRR